MEKRDFFISYSKKNENWAKWIAGTLEENGYSVYVQVWDIVPGDDFMSQMRTFLQCSRNCIAVVSESYWQSEYCKLEFNSAYNAKLNNRIAKLIPIRVEEVSVDALYDTIVHVDLYDKDEKEAKNTLLRSVKQEEPVRRKGDFPKINKARRDDVPFPFDAGQEKQRTGVLVDHVELILRCIEMNDDEVNVILRAVEHHEIQAVGIYLEEENYRTAEVEFAVDWVLHEEMTRISGNMFDTDRCGWKDGTAPEAYVAAARLVEAAKAKKQKLRSWIRVSQRVRESPNLHKQVCQELGYAYGSSVSPWKVPPEEHGRSILGLEEAKVIRREVR